MEPGGQGVAMVTRDSYRTPRWVLVRTPAEIINIHVTFCTNYAVWEWVLENKSGTRPCGTRENKQTNKCCPCLCKDSVDFGIDLILNICLQGVIVGIKDGCLII
jgi:hypothetical protein